MMEPFAWKHAIGSLVVPPRVRSLASMTLILAMACLAGCASSSNEEHVANLGEVRQLMNLLPRASKDPAIVEQIFVEGTAPNQAWLDEISGKLVETNDLTIEGDVATVTFTIESYTGEIESEGTWKCVCKDGEWKFSDTPVPQKP